MAIALKRSQKPLYELVQFIDVAERPDEKTTRNRKVSAYWQAYMKVDDLLQIDEDARARWLDDPSRKRKGILLGVPGALMGLWLVGVIMPTVLSITNGGVQEGTNVATVLISQLVIGLAIVALLGVPAGWIGSRWFKAKAFWCLWRTVKVQQEVNKETGEVSDQRLYELHPLRPKALMESWVKDEEEGRAHAVTPKMMLKVLRQDAWKNTIGGERRGLGKEAFGALLVLALILAVLMVVINAMNTPAVAPAPAALMEVLHG